MRSRTTMVGIVVLLAVALFAGWRVYADRDDDLSAKETALVRELERTGLTLYQPTLRESWLRRPTINDESGNVESKIYFRPKKRAVLSQGPGPDRNPCESYDPAGDCAFDDGVMRYTFEEMSAAAVVRGDTLLTIRLLVTEDDPELLEDAVRALEEAPEVTAEELVRDSR